MVSLDYKEQRKNRRKRGYWTSTTLQTATKLISLRVSFHWKCRWLWQWGDEFRGALGQKNIPVIRSLVSNLCLSLLDFITAAG